MAMDLWKRRWIGQKLRQDQFRQEIIEGIITGKPYMCFANVSIIWRSWLQGTFKTIKDGPKRNITNYRRSMFKIYSSAIIFSMWQHSTK